MARGYPRFLFSNPTNTKSKGPFIIHCIPPRMVFKIYNLNDPSYKRSQIINGLNFSGLAVELIETWDDVPLDENTIGNIMISLSNWMWSQVAAGEIDLKQVYNSFPSVNL